MRNVILFFFPLIIKTIENQAKEREIWLLLAYVIRACILPDEEFTGVDNNEIQNVCQLLYEQYEKNTRKKQLFLQRTYSMLASAANQR